MRLDGVSNPCGCSAVAGAESRIPYSGPVSHRQLSDPAEDVWAQMILRIGYRRPAATTPAGANDLCSQI
jgi:hypothetical protein